MQPFTSMKYRHPPRLTHLRHFESLSIQVIDVLRQPSNGGPLSKRRHISAFTSGMLAESTAFASSLFSHSIPQPQRRRKNVHDALAKFS